MAVWDEFIEWAKKVADLGVGHGPSRDAFYNLLSYQKGNQVHIGVGAPKDVAVFREEIYQRINAENGTQPSHIRYH